MQQRLLPYIRHKALTTFDPECCKFDSDFYIHMYGYKVNGKSILGVMTLAAEQGAELELEIEGPDEKKAAKALVDLINKGFDES